MTGEFIPFNRPYLTGQEMPNIECAHSFGQLAGDGVFSRKCQNWMEESLGVAKALLTHSCTAALEVAALLSQMQPGDEVILPSFTFVSTANAFVLRGATPVFVDIRPDTLNLDESLIDSAITSRTRAIVPVHYAGVSCEMDVIMGVAKKNNLIVIEDAAQAIFSQYKGRELGSIGDIGCLSFHETKNVISGEGGALLLRDKLFSERAEIVREKGTNRSKFFRGQVDKYTWCDVGSSYLPGEIVAAFLWAQLQNAREITNERLRIWNLYHDAFAPLEEAGLIRRPSVPPHCTHNAHMYYILLNSQNARADAISSLKALGIGSAFHYVPLHSSPAGKKYGRWVGDMKNTNELSERLLRLPLWIGVNADRVIEGLFSVLGVTRPQ